MLGCKTEVPRGSGHSSCHGHYPRESLRGCPFRRVVNLRRESLVFEYGIKTMNPRYTGTVLHIKETRSQIDILHLLLSMKYSNKVFNFSLLCMSDRIPFTNYSLS